MELIASLIAAVLLDSWLGEPRKFHPLVGFGKFAEMVERGFYGSRQATPKTRIWSGAIATLVAVAPAAAANEKKVQKMYARISKLKAESKRFVMRAMEFRERHLR